MKELNLDTKILTIEENKLDKADIENGGLGFDRNLLKDFANIIKNGGTVIFPTETVYGLGADGLDENATKKIYEAKGRPSDNPLILHISELCEIDRLAKDIPQKAISLMEAVWPGPLTVVLKKTDEVPMRTSGGLDTIAVRMPSNPIARELIKQSGTAIAAPSANISGRPSPTRASHVIKEMNHRVDGIIAIGECDCGLESTIVDFTGDIPLILRPGAITLEQIKAVVGEADYDPAITGDKEVKVAKAPGMKYTHYSPNADVSIIKGDSDKVASWVNENGNNEIKKGKKVCVMCDEKNLENYNIDAYSLGASHEDVAKNLFNMLIELDSKGYDIIYSEAFQDDGIGVAIMNRLSKSAGHKIIEL